MKSWRDGNGDSDNDNDAETEPTETETERQMHLIAHAQCADDNDNDDASDNHNWQVLAHLYCNLLLRLYDLFASESVVGVFATATTAKATLERL